MITAVDANLERLFQLFLVEVLAALFAAHKDILSPDDAVLVADRLDLAFLFTNQGIYQIEIRKSEPAVSH